MFSRYNQNNNQSKLYFIPEAGLQLSKASVCLLVIDTLKLN